MLLYFGSSGMMHQGNTRLCDVDHRRPEFFGLLELAATSCLAGSQRIPFMHG
jgi:hypothetical protein